MLTIESLTRRPDFEAERATMGAALAIGFTVAGLLGLTAVLLPHPATMDEGGIVTISVVGLVAGALFIVARDVIPLVGYHLAALCGIALITASIDLFGTPSNNNDLFYLYVAGFTFYFFRPIEAIAYTLVVLVAYGWVEGHVGYGRVETVNLFLLAGVMLMVGGMLNVVAGKSRALVSELDRQATTDALTGLLNRRGLQRIVDTEMLRSDRRGGPFSLLIGDLDHFKSVNDRLGHMGGDMALERAAASLAAEGRRMDSIARIGGEEFAMLMPDTGADKALIAAERFRARVSAAFEGRPVELTISIGIASYPRDGRSWEELLDAADTALYAAKDGGRDQVVAFEGPASTIASSPA